MKFFVFVDTPYYPYVDDPIEADSLAEAEAIAAESLSPGDGDTIYVAPMDAVASVTMAGPKPEPKGLLKLLQQQNRYHESFLKSKNMAGGFAVWAEPGSLER